MPNDALEQVELPTRFVATSTWLLYEADLSAPVLRTVLRLLGLAWQHKYQRTPPYHEDVLAAVCGIERSTLFGHLREAVSKGVLRYTSASPGVKVVHFDERCRARRSESYPHVDNSCPESWTDPGTCHVVCDPLHGDGDIHDMTTHGGELSKTLDRLRELLDEPVAQLLARTYQDEAIDQVLAWYERGTRAGEIRGPGWIKWALENRRQAGRIAGRWERSTQAGDARRRRRYVEGEYGEYVRR